MDRDPVLGLIRKDNLKGTQQTFPFPIITALHMNTDGRLWVGTISGLFLFAPQTFTSIAVKPGANSILSENLVVPGLTVTKQGNLWIGTSKGLMYYNKETGSFTEYAHKANDTTSLSDISVTSVLEDKQGRLWVGTHPIGGLNLYNNRTGKFTHYLKGRGITGTIFEDSYGIIWVATHEGIYKYNPAADNFTSLLDPNTGESLNFILSILEDNEKNLWVVTGSELIKINPQRNGMIRFGKNEGVKPNTGYWGTYSGGDAREIFYGDQSGYYTFRPEQLTVNTRPPQIVIIDFRIKNDEQKAGLAGLLYPTGPDLPAIFYHKIQLPVV